MRPNGGRCGHAPPAASPRSTRQAHGSDAGQWRGRGEDAGRGDPRGYGGRSVRGYGRHEPGGPESSGGFYGQGAGTFDRSAHRDPGLRDAEGVREQELREARRHDAGPYPESRSPRHYGLPADLRAGEGDWAQAGGYAELPRDRGGYEARYDTGEWAPGGDASVPLHMGYRDFGVRGHAPRRGRWKREPVLARDIMTSNPASVRAESDLREVARIMRDENTGIVPVCGADGELLGVVTDRDIVMRTLASDEAPERATARDVMTDDVEAVMPDEELRDVVRLMGDRQVRRVPVVERGDRLVGIISMADVATRADYDEDLQDALEEISARRSFWSRLFGG